MKRKRLILLVALFALVPGSSDAETLRAADLVSPTNVNWVVLMRAQKDLRMGKTVDFVWPEQPAVNYAQIRRTLWLAGLHGITAQTGDDNRTKLLMGPEIDVLLSRLKTPFAYDVAIRDNQAAEELIPLLVKAQVGCQLIGDDEAPDVKFPFSCRPSGIVVEGADIVLPSLPIAVSFAQSSHTDTELVFEPDGRIASGLFLRRFKDGTATVVNLTDLTRRNLTYRHGFTRLTFDLYPAGVIHLLNADPPRLTQTCGLRFLSGLWKIGFDGNLPSRVIDAGLLQTIVPESYMGTISYSTTVCVPTGEEMLFLYLDANNSEIEVLIGGQSIGVHAWDPFEWAIPAICRGKNVPLEIRVMKRTINGALQTLPTWRSR